jgi:hypothetical protein
MVRVPTPATQGPQDLGGMETVAAQTPFQQTQLPDLSFNARQLSRVGEALGNVASEFGRRERETVLLEAQRDINDWRNGIFNPDSGVLREEGGNAIGATDRTIANAEQFAGVMEQRYGSRLGPSGRLALRTLLQQETQSVATRVISHETGQRRGYEVTLLQANIEDALDQITSNPTNDEVFNQQVGRILTSTTQASVLSGETGTELGSPAGNRQQEALTAAVGARVAALAGPQFRQPGAAMSLLEEYSDQIDPDTYAELYPQIREANINQRALSEAQAAAITERTGIAPMFVPQAGNASAGGAQIIDYNGMPLAVVQGTNPLIGSLDGASRLTNPDAAVTLDEMLRGPFMVLQRRLGRTLVIRDAIARAGTSREGETPGSQHFSGAALDIDITNMNYQERLMLVQEAMQLGFRGFGFGNGTMHIDMREGDQPTIWTYAGHEAGWNGLNEVQLRALTSGMQQGSWSPTTAAATGGDYISSIADPEVRIRAQEAYAADLRFSDAMQSLQRAEILSDIYTQVEVDYRAQQEGSGTLGDVSTYLTPENIQALGTDAAAARRYIEQIRSGAERVTDQSIYNELYTRATSPLPDIRSAFANDPGALLAAQADLSVSDFRSLQTLQQSLRSETAAAGAESEAARGVNKLMSEVTQTRINGVLPDVIQGYAGLTARYSDAAERAEVSARMEAEALRLLRPQLRAQLASMSDAQRQRIVENPTLLDEMIGNIGRQLMQDVDVSGLPDFDDASFLELISTIDDQEGFTIDQLITGEERLSIPITGVGTININPEAIAMIETDLTSRNNGVPPTPSALLEQVYTVFRGQLAGPGGAAMLQAMVETGDIVRAQLEGGNAPEAPTTPPELTRPRSPLMEQLYTPPTEMPAPELTPETTFRSEPMRVEQIEQQFRPWFAERGDNADALQIPPATAYNYLLYLNQQINLTGGAPIALTQPQGLAILQAVPLQATLEDMDRRMILQRLSGVEGAQGQQLAFEELMRLLNASRLP